MVQAESRNVVATLHGERDDVIVLGAHYDSVPDGPGANDNASGTATVIELARALRARNVPYTVRVVLFGSEEIGLVGSREYISALNARERERIVAMLNFDMVGVGADPQVGGSDELVDLAVSLAEEHGRSVTQIGAAGGGSDHGSFIEAGIPALFFYRSNDPNYHSPNDRAEYVEAKFLESAAQLALWLIDRVGTPGTPSRLIETKFVP
jgi:aminopeptidase YwaD